MHTGVTTRSGARAAADAADAAAAEAQAQARESERRAAQRCLPRKEQRKEQEWNREHGRAQQRHVEATVSLSHEKLTNAQRQRHRRRQEKLRQQNCPGTKACHDELSQLVCCCRGLLMPCNGGYVMSLFCGALAVS